MSCSQRAWRTIPPDELYVSVQKCTIAAAMSTMTATEARAGLPELLDRVAAGEEVIITRHGQPVAVVVRPDVLRVRRAEGALASAATLRQLLSGARDVSLSAGGALTPEYAEALVADVRAGRESTAAGERADRERG